MKRIPQALFKPHLDPEEEVLEVFHRHPFIMFPRLGRILFFTFLIPLFIWYFFVPQLWIFLAVCLFFGLIRVVYLIFNWYHDALLLTNVSLLKTYWSGFFDRSSTRLEYPMMEGLSYTIQGFRRTIFNYGHVSVTRAGGGSSLLELHDAMNPPKVERLTLKQQEKFITSQSMQDSETLKTLLVTMIRDHNKKNPPKVAEPPKPQVASKSVAKPPVPKKKFF